MPVEYPVVPKRVSYVAYASRDGDSRIVSRYLDGTTRTVENGTVTTGSANNTTTWWTTHAPD